MLRLARSASAAQPGTPQEAQPGCPESCPGVGIAQSRLTWRGWPGTACTQGGQQDRCVSNAKLAATSASSCGSNTGPSHSQSFHRQLASPADLCEEIRVLLAGGLLRLQPLHGRGLGGGLEAHGHLQGGEAGRARHAEEQFHWHCRPARGPVHPPLLGDICEDTKAAQNTGRQRWPMPQGRRSLHREHGDRLAATESTAQSSGFLFLHHPNTFSLSPVLRPAGSLMASRLPSALCGSATLKSAAAWRR